MADKECMQMIYRTFELLSNIDELNSRIDSYRHLKTEHPGRWDWFILRREEIESGEHPDEELHHWDRQLSESKNELRSLVNRFNEQCVR